MDIIEKLADDLGQIVFRLDMNWAGFESAMMSDNVSRRVQCREAVNADIENLKDIKARILRLETTTDAPSQIGTSDVQVDGAPVTSVMGADAVARRKKAEGTIDCHLVFVPWATLEKSAPILGKLCRWRLTRYVALKVLNLLLKACNSGLVCFHVLYPFVKYGKSRREMYPVGFVWPNAKDLPPAKGGADEK